MPYNVGKVKNCLVCGVYYLRSDNCLPTESIIECHCDWYIKIYARPDVRACKLSVNTVKWVWARCQTVLGSDKSGRIRYDSEVEKSQWTVLWYNKQIHTNKYFWNNNPLIFCLLLSAFPWSFGRLCQLTSVNFLSFAEIIWILWSNIFLYPANSEGIPY